MSNDWSLRRFCTHCQMPKPLTGGVTRLTGKPPHAAKRWMCSQCWAQRQQRMKERSALLVNPPPVKEAA